MSVEVEYEKWLKGTDENTVRQLKDLNDAEKHDSFYKNIEFGTGGMRGLLGVGTNRINKYTIAKATKGFAEYIKANGESALKRGIVIAHDNRRQSRELSEITAGVLAYEGIKVYLFEDLRTTPELSFAVRHLSAFGGVVITASHNPPEYNGYKLYDETGCQLVPGIVDKIIPLIENVQNELEINYLSLSEAGKLIEIIGKDVDEAYYEKVLGIRFNRETDHSVKIVYTPQHGTGNIPVREVLFRAGYDVLPVECQCFPDTEFKNTKNPNPEMPEAYEKAIEILKETDADIAIATDPDCDRLGAVINCKGDYRLMTGNQSGAVILYYLLSRMKERGEVPENGLMVNTIVTSTLGDKIAWDFGLSVEKTLTGFKFIGEKIRQHEIKGDKKFVFGYEESYGCLIGDFVRDKDAVQASLMFCEAADFYKKQGKTLIDVLSGIYEKYGYFKDSLTSLTLKGEDGAKKIAGILEDLRDNPPKSVAGINVLKITDYNNPPEGFTKSNVLHFEFEDGSFVAVRPSGTEPKCKFYYCVRAENREKAVLKLESFKKAFEK
ncbi:MAG: phospho-sugar mutase [Clostridia bacterium]|nr:phospho-sugar mutase [Clostridia bacterium]